MTRGCRCRTRRRRRRRRGQPCGPGATGGTSPARPGCSRPRGTRRTGAGRGGTRSRRWRRACSSGRSGLPSGADVVRRQRRARLPLGEVDELAQVEIDEVVAGHDQQVVVDALAVDQLGERADDAELLVLRGRLLDRDDRFLERALGEVVAELVGEPLVGRDVDILDAVVRLQLAEDAVDDGRLADREEHLRPVARDGPQARGVPPGKDDSVHTAGRRNGRASQFPFAAWGSDLPWGAQT